MGGIRERGYDLNSDTWMKEHGHEWGAGVPTPAQTAETRRAERPYPENPDTGEADIEMLEMRQSPLPGRPLRWEDLGWEDRMAQRARVQPKCTVCGVHFDGRADARTCGSRCRKARSRGVTLP
jgi:hypothetical protein